MRDLVKELLDFAHHLADLSAEAILPHFRKLKNVEHKEGQWDFDPVTEGDRDGERVIRAAIESTYPDHGIIGEEFGNHQQEAEFCWVIDPIDGTRAFITGVPLWGTLIGLYKNGVPYLGVMNQPFVDERYWCSGEKSFVKDRMGERPIETKKGLSLETAIVSTTGPQFFANEQDLKCFQAVETHTRMTRYGYDCYAYCMLASGNIDIVIESGLSSYDVGALIPIVEQAGGKMTSWTGGAAGEGGQILACGDPALHSELQAILKNAV